MCCLFHCFQDAGYGEKNMCASDDDNEEENQKIDDEVKKIRALRGGTDWGRGGD